MSHVYPHFLIVGFMKSATTTLFDYIVEHPNVQAPIRKELHYFTRELVPNYDPALFGLEYHEQLNVRKAGSKLCGEASPSYIVAADRIVAFNPSTKIIILLRDPVERALSQYKQYVGFQLLQADALPDDGQLETLNFVQDSGYERHIASFLEKFPARNVMLISFEEFCAAPGEAMKHVFRFLGLVPMVVVGDKRMSKSPAVSEPSTLRERLTTYFADKRGAIIPLIEKYGPVTYPTAIDAFGTY